MRVNAEVWGWLGHVLGKTWKEKIRGRIGGKVIVTYIYRTSNDYRSRVLTSLTSISPALNKQKYTFNGRLFREATNRV